MWRWTCLLLFFAAPSFAQSYTTSGELRGMVLDPSSAGIPAAKVTLESVATGLRLEATSDASGEYRFLVVSPGEYEVEISKELFRTTRIQGIRLSLGQVVTMETQLEVGVVQQSVRIVANAVLVETARTQQASTLLQESIAQLPIDRRDYLTFALLAPGIVDSNSIPDNTDYRVKQVPQSGLSFLGSNGRGNSVMIDGGEANDGGGGVRSTLPQEAVQEFQINRSNYSAELGGASGGAIDIVSRSGTNQWHASAFDYLRNQVLDAGNPFARVLRGDALIRVKPSAKRNQFGGSLSGPLRRDKTFVFAAFEGMLRRESSVVSVLSDRSIFQPTPDQMEVIRALPADQGEQLRQLLTAPQSTVDLFERNSGVFPFTTNSWRFAFKVDHRPNDRDAFFFRHNFSHVQESNANLQALMGASRGTQTRQFDPTEAVGWTRILSPRAVNEAHLQFAYRGFDVNSIDPNGPELRIPGFGVFNRDYLLPSLNIERRYELRDNLTLATGRHTAKFGVALLERGVHSDIEVFFGARFTFGNLPGALLNPALPSSFVINPLQAFNLGLAQTYIQGAGDGVVASTQPTLGLYAQDDFQVTRSFKLQLGVRYDLDVRKAPLPTSKANFAPRFGFAWSPSTNRATVLRGGYGIFYAPHYYQLDWTVNALNDIDGRRQIGQAFTSILTPGPAAANNVFSVLRAQGIIGVPTPTRPIQPGDLAQFGIQFPQTGPLPPYSVLYDVTKDFHNPYSQQVFVDFEHEVVRDFAVTVSFNWAHTLRLPRSRDENLLPAPVDPELGIRVWSDAYFANPLIAQRNVFQSTANADYRGLSVQVRRRFSSRLSFDANYTVSKAYDDVTDFNSDFQAFDQMNLRAEHALSAFDQRHKFVAYGSWQGPLGVQISPIFRANSGRPFNLLAGFDVNQDRHDTADRPIGAGRNTGTGPNFRTVDLRLARTFRAGETARIEFTLDAFNLLNRLNYATVNNVVGNMPGPFAVTGRDDRNPDQPLGFTSASDPRRLQVGLRLSF